jgi:CII-binding regulator of phage lambda lysogenization HflD
MVKRAELEAVKEQLAEETRRADSAELDLRRYAMKALDLEWQLIQARATIASLEEANTYMGKRLDQYSEVGQ